MYDQPIHDAGQAVNCVDDRNRSFTLSTTTKAPADYIVFVV